MALFTIVTGLFFFASPAPAADPQIKQMLERFLSQADLKEPPEPGWLGDRLDILRSQPVSEVRAILPLALSLLRSDNPNRQSIGSTALVAIALRQDSAELLGPNIPELVTLLETHDQTHGGSALGILALLNPKPPATLVSYLLPRLLDTKTSTEKLLAISSVLLRAAPDDPNVIGGILNLLQEHSGVQMKCEVIRMIGAAQAVNEGTVAPFSGSLIDPDPNIRLMAIQAVERQRPDVIQRFGPQVRKMTADPSEQSSVRESAFRAVKQLGSQ